MEMWSGPEAAEGPLGEALGVARQSATELRAHLESKARDVPKGRAHYQELARLTEEVGTRLAKLGAAPRRDTLEAELRGVEAQLAPLMRQQPFTLMMMRMVEIGLPLLACAFSLCVHPRYALTEQRSQEIRARSASPRRSGAHGDRKADSAASSSSTLRWPASVAVVYSPFLRYPRTSRSVGLSLILGPGALRSIESSRFLSASRGSASSRAGATSTCASGRLITVTSCRASRVIASRCTHLNLSSEAGLPRSVRAAARASHVRGELTVTISSPCREFYVLYVRTSLEPPHRARQRYS